MLTKWHNLWDVVAKKKYVEFCGTKSSSLGTIGAYGFGPSVKLFWKKKVGGTAKLLSCIEKKV